MHNLVKLVQANGKALLVPAAAITGGILRTLEAHEQALHDKGATHIWLILDGVAQSAIVRERLGFILNKAGGASGDRVTLSGLGETRISLPKAIFAHALESERVRREGDKADGKIIAKEDATIVHTTLRSHAGQVAFYALDGAADLFDLFSADASEDDGAVEYDDEGNEVVAADATPAPKKRAKAA